MTTTPAHRPVTRTGLETSPGHPAVMVRRVVTSELVKLRTLRSHVWLIVTATAFTLLLGPIQSIGQVVEGTPGSVTDSASGVALALTGASAATLVIGVLGVLVVTGEYAPRAIRTTFSVVPRRSYVVLAKSVALALATALPLVVAVVAAVTVSLAILSGAGLHAGWGSPPVFRVAAAMVWYLVGWGLFGLAAGWVTRSKIGGAALLLVVMVVVPPVLGLVPRAGEHLVAILPSSAGGAMISTHHATAMEAPLVGFVLWTVYVVLFTAVAAWVTARRDA
jgi:ABC-2 type transport system permease protein